MAINKKLVAVLVIVIFLISVIAVSAFPIKLYSKDKKSKAQKSDSSKTKESNFINLIKNKNKNNNSNYQNVKQNLDGNNHETTGPVRITRAEVTGTAYVGEAFNVIVEAFDPDDDVTGISLGKSPYGAGNWQPKYCSNVRRCELSWSINDASFGNNIYRIMAINNKNQIISSTISVSVINRPASGGFILRTAAIDAVNYQSRDIINYIMNTNIKIRNTAGSQYSVGNPFVNFGVSGNELFGVSY